MYKFFAKYLFFLKEAKFILQSIKYFKQNYILFLTKRQIQQTVLYILKRDLTTNLKKKVRTTSLTKQMRRMNYIKID